MQLSECQSLYFTCFGFFYFGTSLPIGFEFSSLLSVMDFEFTVGLNYVDGNSTIGDSGFKEGNT